jgi:hypothetical protein
MANHFDIPEKSKQKQCAILLAALLEHAGITTACGRDHYGIMHMAGRVHDLRAAGHLIDTHMIYESDAAGIMHKMACYSLKKGGRP